MRRIPLLILLQFGLLAGALLFADVVTLKDDRQISGSVESGNTQELHIKVGGQVQTIDVHQVQSIAFGPSSPAAPATPPPPKPADRTPATSQPAPAQPNTLILRDGTHVAGRWWSLDDTDLHFLVDNQLQHYPRHDVLGVTFGNASLPPPPERSTPAPAASAAGPARPSPTLAQPRSSPAPGAAPRGVSQPNEIGRVYFWNGKDLTPLEVNRAVERRSGGTPYYEIPGPQSPVRVGEGPNLVFILRLAKGIDPATYSLFPLAAVNGSRRTRSQSARGGVLMTWPVDIKINDDSSLITYELRVRDLPAGEYSFSPSNSNDGYCFGVDPAHDQ